MARSFGKYDVTKDEMLTLRDEYDLANIEIAELLGCCLETVNKYIGRNGKRRTTPVGYYSSNALPGKAVKTETAAPVADTAPKQPIDGFMCTAFLGDSVAFRVDYLEEGITFTIMGESSNLVMNKMPIDDAELLAIEMQQAAQRARHEIERWRKSHE